MKARFHFLLYTLLLGFLLVQVFQMNTTPVVNALPPRPTAVPSPVHTKLDGGFLELQIEGSVVAGIWTVVQWQDALGDWHEVTGWQGTLDEGYTKTWWVGPEDLGTGPFRWEIQLDEAVLATSEEFSLPAQPGERQLVTVLID
ncbi:MAG: hypothetical protein H6667_23620 [Ardenticatenaceae bacterium]|nr:hypothetical protein [Ardenticatenaceae bacterium]MCB9445855.1 hypothetical protein [Ardenticatenaceae bacterium]